MVDFHKLRKVWAVMRSPVVMEDEGRHHLIEAGLTYKEAETWIAAQEGQYFGPGDYYITRQEKSDDTSGTTHP